MFSCPSTYVWQLKIVDWESGRLVVHGGVVRVAANGAVMYSPNACTPAHFLAPGGVLQVSLGHDLFQLGLMIDVLLRPLCFPVTQVLPVGSMELHRAMTDEQFFLTCLECHGHAHEGLVLQLCHFDLSKRGTIDEACQKLTTVTQAHKQVQQVREELREYKAVIGSGMSSIKDTVERISSQLVSLEHVVHSVNLSSCESVRSVTTLTKELRRISTSHSDSEVVKWSELQTQISACVAQCLSANQSAAVKQFSYGIQAQLDELLGAARTQQLGRDESRAATEADRLHGGHRTRRWAQVCDKYGAATNQPTTQLTN